jgi:hypothetical protein
MKLRRIWLLILRSWYWHEHERHILLSRNALRKRQRVLEKLAKMDELETFLLKQASDSMSDRIVGIRR